MESRFLNLKFITTIIVAVILCMSAVLYIHKKYSPINESGYSALPAKVKTSSDTKTPKGVNGYKLPTTLLLPVPFTPQAPTANWDELHNEACEEASGIMAAEYFAGDQAIQLDPKFVEEQISLLSEWQDKNFGYHLDTTSAETARMIGEVYGLQTKLLENFSDADIKKELNDHHVALISENGQKLGNPNYKQPGPIHHMLVIKGYTDSGFITNDSGTKRGLNYFYTFETLKNAAADWDHSTNTVNGNKKIAIVVWK